MKLITINTYTCRKVHKQPTDKYRKQEKMRNQQTRKRTVTQFCVNA